MKIKKGAFTQGHIGGLLVKMTIPMVFGMLSMIVYNLVDTYFVSILGTEELAALGFTISVVLIVGGLALGLGTGVSAVISRAAGRNDYIKVREITTDSMILAISISIVLIILGFVTIKPLFYLLGAHGKVYSLVASYMQVWYLGLIFIMVPMVGNHAIRAIGDTFIPAVIMVIGAVVNLILDPLLIFGIGPFPFLGLRGAAIATVFARFVTAIAAFLILRYKKNMVILKLPSLNRLFSSWRSILYIALPTAFTRVMRPVMVGIITALLASYGTEPVAAFGVVFRIEFFAFSVIIALASVLAPFVGQNLGAKQIGRLSKGMRYSKKFSLFWGILLFLVFYVFAQSIASFFSKNQDVAKYITFYLRVVPIGYGLYGVLLLVNSALNVLHRPFQAAFLMFIQMFVLCIPLAFLGSNIFGVGGIFSAILISYILSGLIAFIYMDRKLKEEV